MAKQHVRKGRAALERRRKVAAENAAKREARREVYRQRQATAQKAIAAARVGIGK